MKFFVRTRATACAAIVALVAAGACSKSGPKVVEPTVPSTAASGTTSTTTVLHHSLIACDGNWQSVPPPGGGYLLGVDAKAADRAWAAGRDGDGKMVVDRWDGKSWQVAWTGPNGTLYSIREIAPNDVWASGRGGTGAATVHWDGRKWASVPIGIPEIAGATILISLAPLGPADIWAVGLFVGRDASFRLHWNGSAWSLDSAGVVDGTALRSAETTPQGTIWAVGETIAKTVHSPLIEHWTSSQGWQTVPAPPIDASTQLHGVLPVTDHDVWMIGFLQPLPTASRQAQAAVAAETPIGLHVTAGSVNPTTMQNVAASGRPRHGAALSSTDLFAVGDSNSTGSLIEHGDGSTWSVMPNPSTQRLFGASASPSSEEVWAVGYGPTIVHFCR